VDCTILKKDSLKQEFDHMISNVLQTFKVRQKNTASQKWIGWPSSN